MTRSEEEIYRKVQAEFVSNDALVRAEELDIELSEDEAARIGCLWAYEGKYECNLSYWDNIDNLITEVKGKE